MDFPSFGIRHDRLEIDGIPPCHGFQDGGKVRLGNPALQKGIHKKVDHQFLETERMGAGTGRRLGNQIPDQDSVGNGVAPELLRIGMEKAGRGKVIPNRFKNRFPGPFFRFHQNLILGKQMNRPFVEKRGVIDNDTERRKVSIKKMEDFF